MTTVRTFCWPMFQWATRFLTLGPRAASPPRIFASTGIKDLPVSEKIEEENYDWYDPKAFYPVRIGQTFQSRYQVITKLGHGSSGTVWLVRDLQDHRYVALKVCMTGFQGVAREKDALARLASLSLCPYIQKTLDTFMLEGEPGHMHECFVSEALTINLLDSKSILPASVYDLGLFRKVARQVLEAVKFLHTEASMIHGGKPISHLSLTLPYLQIISLGKDLRLENFLMRVSSQEYLKHLEAMERQRPSPRKTDGNRIIYERPDHITVPMDLQCPVLCDYGEARLVNSDTPLLSDIQPFLYRAPEVVLCMPWSYSADVWNIGVMLWELFEDRPLFDACTADGENSSIVHLAEMIGVMGLPPLDFLRRTADPEAIFEHCFDESGRWIGCDAPIHDTPLETLETRLEGKDKAEFLRFMRRILKWIPEERATAAELCEDPWLNVEY